jgi:O-antigen ligase
MVLLPIAAMVLVIGLLAATCWLWGTGDDNCVVEVPKAVVGPLLCLIVSSLLSIRFSQHPYASIGALPGLLANVAVFFLATRMPREQLAALSWCWLGAAVLVAVNGLARATTEPEFNSTIGNGNFLAAYLATGVCLGCSLVHRRHALLVGGAVLCLLGAMVLCRSRGTWLALGMVAATVWIISSKPRWRRLTMVLLIGATAAFLGRGYIRQQWQTDVRPMIWQGTVRMIRAAPVLGHGLGTFAWDYAQYRPTQYFLRPKAANTTEHAHNELLEVAAEQGLLGLAATVALWGAALWLGWRHWRALQASGDPASRITLGLLAAAMVLILHGMVDVDLRHPPNQQLLWLLLGLLVNGADSFQFPLKSTTTRRVLAAGCVALAIWISLRVVPPVRADWLERQARQAESGGKFDIAAATAAQALDIEPFRLNTRYFLAGALARSPQPALRPEAVRQCLRLEELAPDYSDITFNLGQLYFAGGQPALALPYLQRAVTINPYSPNKRVILAHALAATGARAAAQDQVQAALQLNPQYGPARALQNALPPPATKD